MTETLRASEKIESKHTTSAEIRELLFQTWQDRIYNPLDNPYATDQLAKKRDEWRNQGKTVVFTSGVYDLMHPKHHGYLIETKAQAADVHFDRLYADTGAGWQKLTTEEQSTLRRELLTDGSIKQIVSVDGNSWVAKRKGNKPEKGNSIRPILDWQTRAIQVAGAMIRATEDKFIPVVDAVTMHDQVDLAQTSHRGTVDLAVALQPDVWTIFHESTDILEAAPSHPDLQGTRLVCIGPDEYPYIVDKLLGQFSTTAIVNKIGGKEQ